MLRTMPLIALLLLASCTAASAQKLADAAHIPAIRKAFDSLSEALLKCEIKPEPAELSYSLRFQTGYIIKLSASECRAPRGCSILVRVIPEGSEATYLVSSATIPNAADANLEVEIHGNFVAGEGSYRVTTLIEDGQHRSCRSDWNLAVKRAAHERDIEPRMPPNTVDELWSPAQVSTQAPLMPRMNRMTVFLDAAPVLPRAAVIQDYDLLMLTGSLTALLEQVPARELRIVVLNLEHQTVLLRDDRFTLEGVSKVAELIRQLRSAAVDYRVLQNRQGAAALLAGIVEAELNRQEPSDAVVFLGPGTRVSDAVRADALDRRDGGRPRFFYLELTPPIKLPLIRGNPAQSRATNIGMHRAPGLGDSAAVRMPPDTPDSIEQLTRRLKGEVLVIRNPHDLAKAIGRIR
jgi:hypothetical protein